MNKFSYLLLSNDPDVKNYFSNSFAKFVCVSNEKEFSNMSANLKFNAVAVDEELITNQIQYNLKALSQKGTVLLLLSKDLNFEKITDKKFTLFDASFDTRTPFLHIYYLTSRIHQKKLVLVENINKIKKIKHDLANNLTTILGRIIKVKNNTQNESELLTHVSEIQNESKKINSNIQSLAEIPELLAKETI